MSILSAISSIISSLIPNFYADGSSYKVATIGGKVLRFRVDVVNNQIAYPDEAYVLEHRKLHAGSNPPHVQDVVKVLDTLSDEELAHSFGLMRRANTLFGYTQPFYKVCGGVFNALTGVVESSGSDTSNESFNYAYA